MKILSIHIGGYGKFVDLDREFSPDVNVIRGRNEAGKSTLHSFMEAMILGPNRKPRNFSRSVYESMEPWQEGVPYAGSMRVEVDDSVFRIERNFSPMAESLKVFREDTGEEIANPEEFLKMAREGLSPEACRNSISVGQLSAKTGAALGRELSAYISNMGTTQTPDLNADRAIRILREKKEALRAVLQDDAARDYAASLSRIKNIENELNRPENENHIRKYEDRKAGIRAMIEQTKEQLTAVEERIDRVSAELLEHHIRTRDDVAAMEQKAADLYKEYSETLADRKSPVRMTAMILSGIVLAAGAAGAVVYRDLVLGSILFVTAIIAFAVLILLLVIQHNANRHFVGAESRMLEYMSARTGAAGVSETTVEELKQFIHAQDPLLDDRDAYTKEKNELEEKLSALVKEDAEVSDALTEQTKIMVRVEGKLSEENGLRDQAAALRQRIAENNRLKEQMDAIDIAIDTIGDLSATIRGRLGTYLNNEASRALKSLTGGHYRSMDIGSGMDMALNSGIGMIGVNEVSAGTIDQIYLAVRLAAARFMMNGRDALPLIFDDSFALYDDERLQSALNFVESDYKGQVFIFTCHHREERALEGKDFRLVEL